MQFVHINGVAIHYDASYAESGRPAIVFINSLGTDRRIWHHVLPKLAGDFTLVTYDKRGHGLSDLGQPPYSIELLAQDLAALIDHLELSQVVLVGLSVGGLIAQGLYDARPDLVKAMVLSNTAHKIGTAESWQKRIAAVEQGGIASILDSVMERWFTPPFRVPENAAYQGYCNMLVRQSASGYTGTCAAIRDADFTQAATRIAVPVLCIAGEQDGSTPPELVKSTADLIPGARYEIIENVAHIPCVEAPAVHAALVRGFVEQLDKE
ncbi:3-oxoadipate enol-lactonase [Neorhizobium lilium]|uniref:3-oxoadipate enol-lactonase n=1 Tax=Neorhizobium lilium TaxID=2503024 RepID=A0A3S3RKY7_9HYPH|nr:3-oxoadipate enol-lactonase [Neorhizobium lilium]RWX80934.1 3-oxoadipate enol-lactonase [Neorhizobium lilium]